MGSSPGGLHRPFLLDCSVSLRRRSSSAPPERCQPAYPGSGSRGGEGAKGFPVCSISLASTLSWATRCHTASLWCGLLCWVGRGSEKDQKQHPPAVQTLQTRGIRELCSTTSIVSLLRVCHASHEQISELTSKTEITDQDTG